MRKSLELADMTDPFGACLTHLICSPSCIQSRVYLNNREVFDGLTGFKSTAMRLHSISVLDPPLLPLLILIVDMEVFPNHSHIFDCKMY